MNNDENEPWYGVKALFVHSGKLIEERIIIVKAKGFDDAQRIAINEANEHVEGIEDTTSFLGIVDIYHMFTDTVKDHTEVYSHMTDFTGDSKEYVRERYEKWDGSTIFFNETS